MNMLEKFMSNTLVIKINDLDNINNFVNIFASIGFERIKDFYRVSKGNYNWMLNNYPINELCIEYQIGKGFTISGKTENLNYGKEVVDWFDFIMALRVKPLIDKKYLPIFDEINALPDKIDVVLRVRTFDGSRDSYVSSRPGAYGFRTCANRAYAIVFKSKKALQNAIDTCYSFGECDHYEFIIE